MDRESDFMKDVSDLFVWIWSLIQTAAHYIYEAGRLFIVFIIVLYNGAYQYMDVTPAFHSVPYLGKVILSGMFAGIAPLIALAILRAIGPAIVRGHMQEAFGSNGSTRMSSSASTTNSSSATQSSGKPYLQFDDPNVRVSNIKKGLSGQYTATIRSGNRRQNLPIPVGSRGAVTQINALGSRGTVEWGD